MSQPSETARPIAQAVQHLVAMVAGLNAAPCADPCGLAAAVLALDALRRRYKTSPALFADHLEALKVVSNQLADLEARWVMEAAQAFVEADRAMRREEARRDDCRELLIRAAESKGVNRWDVGDVEIAAQKHLSLDVPQSGSPDRVALERYLDEHGLWRTVSALNRTLLIKALEGGQVAGEDRTAIERWCGPGTTWRLLIRPRNGPPSGGL